MALLSRLHGLRNAAQIRVDAAPTVVLPASITTLGAVGPAVPLTYNAVGLLQAPSASSAVSGFLSGLTPAQQRQFALSLGLGINATSATLGKAIDALLTPATPAQLFDVTIAISDLGGLLQDLLPALRRRSYRNWPWLWG
jgi:hypothetical protein